MVGEVIGRHSQSPDEQACTLQREYEEEAERMERAALRVANVKFREVDISRSGLTGQAQARRSVEAQ
eukprot:COSAG05_NODE_579_length_8556_cov_44.773679_1_plen_67_part_00